MAKWKKGGRSDRSDTRTGRMAKRKGSMRTFYNGGTVL